VIVQLVACDRFESVDCDILIQKALTVCLLGQMLDGSSPFASSGFLAL